MEIDLICETCGHDLVGDFAKYANKFRFEVAPCETCLEAARQEIRDETALANQEAGL